MVSLVPKPAPLVRRLRKYKDLVGDLDEINERQAHLIEMQKQCMATMMTRIEELETTLAARAYRVI